MKYSYWRTDKDAEEGFSKELISSEFKRYEKQTTLDELETYPDGGKTKTLYQAFINLEKRVPDHPWLGTKVKRAEGFAYEWITVKETHETVQKIASGMMSMNLAPEQEAEGKTWKMVGIQSKNRKEWAMMHFALQRIKGTTIALYDTLGQEAARYVCNQTELATICCSADLIEGICKLKQIDLDGDEKKMECVKNIVSFDPKVDAEILNKAELVGLKVVTLDEVIEQGTANLATFTTSEPDPEDIFMLSYTSGTTGDPKGVKLSHKMVMQCAESVNSRLGNDLFTEADSYISYLPAAHSFEQALMATAMVTGMKIGYYGGDPLKLVPEDLPTLKPTFLPSVPRIYNRIYGKVKDTFNAATGCKASLVNNAVNTKMANFKRDGTLTHGCWDSVVFKKVKALVGGNVRIMLTGSAPIAADVLDFLKICFCCDIIEGYGMTETSAGSFTTLPGDSTSGHVGGPCANVKIRLRDIPEMGYLSSNNPPKGEVCFWGPSIMSGYFKNEEKTKEAFHGEWLLSGDVGMINPDGSLKIVDRAKNIFKLSQGEYIAPEKCENVYVQSGWLAQVWVHGDSLRDYVVMIAVVDPDKFKAWAKEKSLEATQENLSNQELLETVHEDCMKLAAGNKFNSLEKPKAIKLILDPWTQDNDMLTPTFKLKRNIAKKMYEETILELYNAPVLGKKK